MSDDKLLNLIADCWCVTDGTYCYRKDGHKSHERNPSGRTQRFKNAYRFTLDNALALAQKVAPKMTINGKTAAEIWEWENEQ